MEIMEHKIILGERETFHWSTKPKVGLYLSHIQELSRYKITFCDNKYSKTIFIPEITKSSKDNFSCLLFSSKLKTAPSATAETIFSKQINNNQIGEHPYQLQISCNHNMTTITKSYDNMDFHISMPSHYASILGDKLLSSYRFGWDWKDKPKSNIQFRIKDIMFKPV